MDQPKISIITPAFNGRAFIEECIKSVIDQACPRSEHIIVDGGSPDGTVDIIKDYAARYPHIRWVSEKDQGQSDATNKGIRMAKSRIIGILNVDDHYEPGVLNRVLDLFKTLHEPAFLIGNCRVLTEQGVMCINRPSKLKQTDLLMGGEINPHPYNPSAYFYHKSLHDKIGYYKIDEHYVMDLEFILRAVRVAHVRYVDELWGNFRYFEGTKTFTDKNSGLAQARIKTLRKIYIDQLPFYLQWKVGLGRWWGLNKGHYFYLLKRPFFYLCHPEAISRLLKR